jgi:hypothetical protein
MSGRFNWDKIQGEVEKHNNELKEKIKHLKNEVLKQNQELSRLSSGYAKGIIKEQIFIELSKSVENEIEKIEGRIQEYEGKLKVLPDQPKELNYDMAAENFIGEFQKSIDYIEVSNLPLSGNHPFNKRKDNIVYQLKINMLTGEELINCISSRDKRVFTPDWEFTGVSFDKARKIEL